MKKVNITGEFIGSFDEFKKKHKEVAIWMQEEEREAFLRESYNKVKKSKTKVGE